VLTTAKATEYWRRLGEVLGFEEHVVAALSPPPAATSEWLVTSRPYENPITIPAKPKPLAFPSTRWGFGA
jgi:hypothetical protein